MPQIQLQLLLQRNLMMAMMKMKKKVPLQQRTEQHKKVAATPKSEIKRRRSDDPCFI